MWCFGAAIITPTHTTNTLIKMSFLLVYVCVCVCVSVCDGVYGVCVCVCVCIEETIVTK